MEIEILKEKENPTLGRKEYNIKITHDTATPTRSEVKSKMEALVSASKDKLIVDSFKSKFGSPESVGMVKVYNSKEELLAVEEEGKLLKNYGEEGLKKLKGKTTPEKETKKEEKEKEKS